MAQTIGIKDMRAFFAIVEEGNISHAAIRLGIAQPALSRRGSRRIRLTEAGQVLYNRVENILGLVDGTVREIKEIGSGTKGAIRIGTITTSGAMILPDLIAEFRKLYPDVTFEIWEAEGARIIELLDSRLIEIAITRTQVDNLNYDLLVLPNEPLVVVMNSKSLCGAKKETVKLEELKDQPMIIPLRWKSSFVAACRKLDFEPNIICVSDSIVQDLMMVKMNLGAALIPFSGRRLLTDGNLTTHTVVAWRKNQTLSSSCKNFLELFKKMFMPKEID